MNDERWLSMSATLNGQEVRITVAVKEIDIVTRDNETSFDVEENASYLENILFEDIYDG